MSRQTPGQRWCSVVLFAVFASLFLYYGVPALGYWIALATHSADDDVEEPIAAVPADVSLRAEQAAFFARASQQVRPAVIRVDAVHIPHAAGADPAALPGDEPSGSIRVTRGCGLVVDRQGIAVTSRRIVAGADLVRIYLSRRPGALVAQLAGSDRTTDLAILRFSPPPDLAVATLTDGRAVQPGACAMVLGNAYVSGEFICVGTIDSPGRQASPAAWCSADGIRTSAANLWNCGGPVVDLDGQVVGLATSLRDFDASPDAIVLPAFTVRRVVHELQSHGKILRGWLGVFVHKVAREERAGDDEAVAFAVDYVAPASPAALGDLRPGDVIVRFAEAPLQSSSDFRRRIADTPPATPASVTVVRAGVLADIRVLIAPQPQVAPALPGELEWGIRLLGELSPEETRYYGAEKGVVVEQVAGWGRQLRLLPRDLIVAINGTETPNLEAFCRVARLALENSGRSAVKLDLLSQGARRTVDVYPAADACR